MDRVHQAAPRSASSSGAATPAGSTRRLTRATDVTAAASAASSANGAAASSQSIAASARPAVPASLPASTAAGSGRVTEQLRSHLQRELSSAESAMNAALRARGIPLTGGTTQVAHLGEEVLRRRQQAAAQAQQQAHPQPRLLASLFPTDAFPFPSSVGYPSSSVVVAPVRATPPAHACQTCGSVAPPSKQQQQQQAQMPEKAGANGPTQMARCTGCRVVHYCSRSCQRLDWQKHKLLCRQIRTMDAHQMCFYKISSTIPGNFHRPLAAASPTPSPPAPLLPLPPAALALAYDPAAASQLASPVDPLASAARASPVTRGKRSRANDGGPQQSADEVGLVRCSNGSNLPATAAVGVPSASVGTAGELRPMETHDSGPLPEEVAHPLSESRRDSSDDSDQDMDPPPSHVQSEQQSQADTTAMRRQQAQDQRAAGKADHQRKLPTVNEEETTTTAVPATTATSGRRASSADGGGDEGRSRKRRKTGATTAAIDAAPPSTTTSSAAPPRPSSGDDHPQDEAAAAGSIDPSSSAGSGGGGGVGVLPVLSLQPVVLRTGTTTIRSCVESDVLQRYGPRPLVGQTCLIFYQGRHAADGSVFAKNRNICFNASSSRTPPPSTSGSASSQSVSLLTPSAVHWMAHLDGSLPLAFTLGSGDVALAWDRAVATMFRGELAHILTRDDTTGQVSVYEIQLHDFYSE